MLNTKVIIWAALVLVGAASGAFIDNRIMQGRIDKITIAHAEELRAREVKRSEDERVARSREQQLAAKVGEIEQVKQNEIDRVSTDAAALIARLRNQAASKPASTSSVPRATATCQDSAGAILPDRTSVDLVALAQRADEMRAALGACYQAYDSVARQ